MAFGEHAVAFAFNSDRFDHSSELPPEANAGNRFYGRDVAEFVADGLGRRGFETSFIDEDWGWQTHAKNPDGTILEISISDDPNAEPASENTWALMLRALRKEKVLGFLSRFREIEVGRDAIAALEDVFGDANIALRKVDD